MTAMTVTIDGVAYTMTPVPSDDARDDAAAPKREVPDFIVARARNREANKALAAMLRRFGIEPKGAAWAEAKAHVAAGDTPAEAAARIALDA